jgi:hypothetical protein
VKFDSKKFIKEMMGKPVEITGCLFRERDSEMKRIWCFHEMKPRHGWVVGVTYLRTGVVIRGYFDEPNTFKETGPRRLVYLVSPWPTMRHFNVPVENVRLIDPNEFSPRFHTKEERKLMSDCMKKIAKELPRDKKGRWIKILREG